MKNLTLIVSVLLSGILFFSCGKDEDDGDGFEKLPYSGVYDGLFAPEFETPSTAFTIEFKNNGTYSISGSANTSILPNISGTHTLPTPTILEAAFDGTAGSLSGTFNDDYSSLSGGFFINGEAYDMILTKK